MRPPFSVEQFFGVFARYNQAIWPAQWLLTVLACAAVGLIIVKPGTSARIVASVLAVLWLWMGIVYHLAFFSAINPAARIFGAAFIVEAIALTWLAARARSWRIRLAPDVRGVVGGLLVAYALVVYPLIGYFAGDRYPATPTFGAPCPTTIFTFGVLLWVVDVPWRVVIIPAGWALIATFAAVHLSVPQDYGLLVAGVATVALLMRRSASRRTAGTNSQRINPIPNPAQRQ